MTSFARRTARPVVEWIIRRSLRDAFDRVGWVGPAPSLPCDRPVVCYANHHTFYDGYLLWLLLTRHLGRRSAVWMRDWDRFPFFAAVGAMPFPPDDARRRARTVRATGHFFRREPSAALALFPEGAMHPPEEGVAEFSADALARMDRLLGEPVWWPVAIHMSWREAPRPVALLAGGRPHAGADGDHRGRLETMLVRLRHEAASPSRVLLRGHRSLAPRWNMKPLRALFDFDS